MRSLDLLRRPRLTAAVALSLLTLAVYSRTLANGFVDYDDRTYVVDNETVRRGLTPETAAWAFTTTTAANWHPLTWLSHLADVSLFGLDPAGHHATSVALHLAVTLLLFASLERMTGRPGRSAFVAALHAVHPLHVESVAWVAERKDVLSALLAWAAILVWSRQRSGGPGVARHAAVMALLGAGLMVKPMLVTLPVLLLLLDLWPLGRSALARAEKAGTPGRASGATPLRRLVVEKLPLLALAVASSAVTIFAQRAGGAVASLQSLPLGERVANAVVAPVAYLAKALWPARLAVFYPHPRGSLAAWQVAGAAALLALLTVAAVRAWRRRPYLAVGWLWFLISLVPVLGIVQVGNQAWADRYTYLPLTGPFLIVAWGVPDRLAGRRAARLLPALACAWIGVLAAVSWVQIGHWRNGITLFEHALAVTAPNATAYSNLGGSRLRAGDRAGAESALERAIELDGTMAPALENLGLLRLEQGRAEEAVRLLSRSVDAHPDDGLSRLNLANAHHERGDDERALAELDEAVRLLPGNAAARSRRALLLAERGRGPEAMADAEAALRSGAEDPAVRSVAGTALI
ncbi:MAG: tetratricopeptide repeat protein, partial [Thermoanaerobaculia bacterium]